MSKLRNRIGGELDPAMQRFGSSVELDRRLIEEDIRGSISHARMLGEQGILSPEVAKQLVRGLEEIRAEWAAGTFLLTDDYEDAHMAVEARLIEKVGPIGGSLHTARSRNDQIATDLRLWMSRKLGEIDSALIALIESLLTKVEEDGKVLIPGFTHLQRGQPIFLGHHLLAHAWALSRDRARLAGAHSRVDECPLGSCAMAGTPFPIDRERTAELLGFGSVMENAMDGVSARDHVLETVSALAILAIHLSRMAEELVLWSSSEFGLVELDTAYASSSSIMPQKRNPDAAELVRGHSGRSAGALMGLLVLLKGLPLAYNRDLQEERFHLYQAVDSSLMSLEILRGVYVTLHVSQARYGESLRGDPSLATELADYLASAGVPFRDAHDRVARLVARLEAEGRGMKDLRPEEAAELDPKLTPAELEFLMDPVEAARRRRSRGGPAPEEQDRQVALLRGMLKKTAKGP
jgi:argininosuccinate lyase